MIKLKQILTEKKELGGALINTIERFTDQNHHTEARLVLAKALGDKKLVKAYESIDVIHMYLRDMNDLSKARNRLDKKLFAYAKKTFSDYYSIERSF